MLATLSPEARLKTGLNEINCAGRVFVEIAKRLGVRIAQGPLSEALAGKRLLDQHTANQLLELLSRMKKLEIELRVPVDWTRVEQASDILVLKLVEWSSHGH